MNIVEISIAIVNFLLGFLVFYLTAYSKTKGKNKALKEDISKLEDEKQKIIAKYQAETESIKKQHTLDIEKRKFQYEDKRIQFQKYFSILDQFHAKSNKIFTERLAPLMNEFMASSSATDDESNKAFNSGIQSLFNELYEEQIKISSETNSIRLISSPEIDELLVKLESAIKASTDDASNMLKFMATPEFMSDQTLLSPHQQKAEKSGASVLEYHKELRNRMKYELNEI